MNIYVKIADHITEGTVMGRSRRRSMRMRLTIAVTLIIGGFAGALPQGTSAQGDHQESMAMVKLCSAPGNPCAALEREAEAIGLYPQKVIRDSDRLRLILESGKELEFIDSDVAAEHRAVHRFVTYFLQVGYSLIQVSGFEGRGYLLIHGGTGTVTRLDGIPVISPDNVRFVTTSLDLEAGYRPNRISIYRFAGDGTQEEWRRDFRGSGPAEASWVGPETVSFFEMTTSDGGRTYSRKEQLVKQTGGRWQLGEGE